MRLLQRTSIEDRDIAVVVAWPVDQAQVGVVDTGEQRAIDEPAIRPEPTLGAFGPLEHLIVQPPGLLAVDLSAVDEDPERVRLVVTVLLVSFGAGNDMPTAHRSSLQHEGISEALHAVRLRRLGLGVWLPRLGLGLGPYPVLGAGQRQDIAELGGVDDDARAKPPPPPLVEMDGVHPSDAVAGGLDGRRLGTPEDAEPSANDERLEPRFQDAQGHAWLEGEPGDPTGPGVGLGLGGQRWRQPAVVIANGPTERVVRARAAEALDVVVLVEGRHSLSRELSADPVGFLEKADCAAGPNRGQRSRHATGAPAHHQHVAADIFGVSGHQVLKHGCGRVARRQDLHDV